MIPAQEVDGVRLLHNPPGAATTFASASTCCSVAASLVEQFQASGEPDAGLLLQAKHYANRAISITRPEENDLVSVAELILCDVARLSHQDWRQVEAMYERFLAKHPSHAGARHNLALLYLDWNPAKAVPQFVMATKLAPQRARHSIGLAQAYLKLHQYGLAGAALEAARKIDPDNPQIKPLYEQVSRRGWTPIFENG